MLRHRFICQKHEILDQPGSRIALLRQDLRRTAVLIQPDPALREIKIHGSSPMSPLPDQAGKPGHVPEHGDQAFIAGRFLRVVLFQDRGHTSIGHPFLHPDHGRRNGIIRHLSLSVQRHQTAERQSVLPGIQGTDAV